MNVVIGLDIGSTAIKAVLYSQERNAVLHSHRSPLEARVSTRIPGHYEEDPVVIRESAFKVIRELALLAAARGDTITAIGLTGQMHGGLLADANLEPLSNFISWQDKRGDETAPSGRTYVEELNDFFPADPTGVGIHTGFLLASLHWLHSNTQFPSRTASILGIHDWIASLLIGRAVTDISSAAAWAMFDPISKRWRTDAIQFASVSLDWLPEVAEPGKDLGVIDTSVARSLGLPLDVHIHATIGDTQASYLGSRCAMDEVLLNFGTGSQSMWETATPIASDGTDIRYLQNDRWLVTAPTLAGGEAYRILAEFFRDAARAFANRELSLDETFEFMDRLALESTAEGISFDPIFAGSKFLGRDAARSSIAGLDATNFRVGPIIQALMEGMIEEVAAPYFVREGVQGPRGSGVPSVGSGQALARQLVGGGSGMRRNQALREAAEARFSLPLRVAECVEEAALGAALLACGLFNRQHSA